MAGSFVYKVSSFSLVGSLQILFTWTTLAFRRTCFQIYKTNKWYI